MTLSTVVELLDEQGYTLSIQVDKKREGGLRCLITRKDDKNERDIDSVDLGFYEYDHLLAIAKDFLIEVLRR